MTRKSASAHGGGGSAGARIGLWAALAGITGVGVAIALRRGRARADALAAAADRGEAMPDAYRAEAVYRARESARAEITPSAHVSMTDDEFEYERHGATVLGSAHRAPGAGRPRTVPGRSPGERPADDRPGRAGLA